MNLPRKEIRTARIVVLGAGPTGLGAALRLLELGHDDFLLVEAEQEAGGLSSSVVDELGFTWDMGGHIQFSHYEKFDEYMALALPDEDWLPHQRESWVWLRGRFVPYPFQYNLHRLPREEMWRCVEGLLDLPPAQQTEGGSFRDWILSTFGAGIADIFLLPYNFKVWGYPPETMNRKWVGERVAVPELRSVLRSICLGEDNVSWGPNNLFRFPRRGGTGAIWRSLAERIPERNKAFGQSVAQIDPRERLLRTDQGLEIRYDRLVSSIPVDRLTAMLGDPELAAASGLRYSSVHIVGLGLRGQPPEHLRTKCWMYFPQDDSPFFRVTVFSNYSPLNTPDPENTWSLMAEVSETPVKPVDAAAVVEEVIAGCLASRLLTPEDRIVSRWHRRLHHGYPTPSLERDGILERVLPALDSMGIHSRGRFGAWKYEVSNQDHSFMQGVEVVDRLLHGREEITLSHPDRVNGRRNPFPYAEWHERTAT